MDEQSKAEMLEDLISELKTDDTEVNESLLKAKLNNAIREIKREINYPSNFSEDAIMKDLEKYYGNIHDLTIYDYNQIGAEGETSHSENGTSRTWKSRRDCFLGIVSYAQSVS